MMLRPFRAKSCIASASVMLAASAWISSSAWAAQTKLSCFTEHLLVTTEGAPVVILATFDDELSKADLFVQDYGGLLRGANVKTWPDMVTFDFVTADGTNGSVVISRASGRMLVTLKTTPERQVLASCRKRENRF